MWVTTAEALEKKNCTWPPIRSVMAWPAPLYGMWTISVLVPMASAAAARCPGVAVPDDAVRHAARLGTGQLATSSASVL
jgi:hypothetical protein